MTFMLEALVASQRNFCDDHHPKIKIARDDKKTDTVFAVVSNL